jgi:cytidine deaminase
MELSADDLKLIERARELVSPTPIPGGINGELGAALRTDNGQIFTGICLHLVCGHGCCGEHTAIGTAVTALNATTIDTIVVVNQTVIIPPCGRCRELMNVLSTDGPRTWVLVSTSKKVQLKELLPSAWDPSHALSPHQED